MLGQIAQSFSLGKNHLSCIGGELAYDNLEQSGFARSVNAYDGGFFLIFYMKGNLGKDLLCTEGLADMAAG